MNAGKYNLKKAWDSIKGEGADEADKEADETTVSFVYLEVIFLLTMISILASVA